MFGGTFKIWNKKNKNKVVVNEAKLPGIIFIFPIPNKVTNKKLILLRIFYNRSYYFKRYSLLFSY